MFPKTESLWKYIPTSRPLLGTSFGVPSNGALALDYPHKSPTERDAPFPEPSSIHLSKTPVYEPLSRYPSGAPMETDARLQSFGCRDNFNFGILYKRKELFTVHSRSV